MDNDEEEDANTSYVDNTSIHNEDDTNSHQNEKTPIQKLFMYSYSIFIFILLLCILYLLYRYFTKNTSISPEYYNQSSSPNINNINIIPENDRVYISNMLDNFIRNGS
jgi:lipopolysaccharide/colanic/teichoic acid biosynthesis glycosyltransferase